jgi:lipopolysaccharide transport system ATP-binding protein
VLAVGDANFQKKCLGKMSKIAHGGRTVLFVSHNHLAIRNLCSHALILTNGIATPKLGVQSALRRYSLQYESWASSWRRPSALKRPSVYFDTIEVRLEGKQPSLQLCCTACIKSTATGRSALINVDILDDTHSCIMQADPSSAPFVGGNQETIWLDLSIELPPLIPGVYHLNFWLGPHNSETFDYIKGALGFEVTESPTPGRTFPHSKDRGSVVPHSTAIVRLEPSKRPVEIASK